MDKMMLNEEKNLDGTISRVIIRDTAEGGFQIDVFADGNQTGQEYTRQELRMIRELIVNLDLDNAV